MPSRLLKFLRLSFSDRRLLLRAALAVASAKLAVRTLSLPAARAALARLERLGRPGAPTSAERIIWAVESAGNAIPGMGNCLVLAVAAEALLARAGHPCEFRIGAAKSGPGGLIAHAWLESEGRVLIGDFELDRYTPFVAPQIEGDRPPARR